MWERVSVYARARARLMATTTDDGRCGNVGCLGGTCQHVSHIISETVHAHDPETDIKS